MTRLYIILFALVCSFVAVFADTDYAALIEAGRTAEKDGKFDRARDFYTEALQRMPSDSVVDKYEAHGLLRNLFLKIESYPEAICHSRYMLEIFKEHVGISHDLTSSYNILADTYAKAGDFTSAQCYLDSALYCVQLPGSSMEDKLWMATQIAQLYSRMGNLDKAVDSYSLAAEFGRRLGGSTATVALNMYANSLYNSGKIAEAADVYGEQRQVAREAMGEDSDEYRWASCCVANIMAFNGDIPGGSAVYVDVAENYRRSLVERLRTLPSESREAALGNMMEIMLRMIPYGIEARNNEDEFTRTAYDALLLTKGLLLASDRTADDIIAVHGSAADRADLARLDSLRLRITELEALDPRPTDDIRSVYSAIKDIDNRLAEACTQYGDISAFASIHYEDVRDALGPDEVLLDFSDFKGRTQPRRYVCFEIRRGQRYPKVHRLFSGEEIDSLVTFERGVWSNLYSGESAGGLARIVGRSLREIIGDARTVYYVPSGVVHRLSPEAIPADDDGRLLGDIYDMRRLSSAREVTSAPRGGVPATACLFGGLEYDAPGLEGIRGGSLAPLPRSLEEVTDISAVIGGARLYRGADGTVESFMAMSGDSPDVIHVSTHGFHYAPDEDRPESLQGYRDAMSLSGLVMSGGNAGWLGVEPSRGILTAQQVAACDFSGTDLVCLASCHSGRGEVTTEGLYGLQRGFKKAGAGSIVMNLWEASDVATKCFMTNFYTDLVNGSRDRHRAFRHARDAVRAKYPSPYYWAGFIMVD